MSLLLISCDKNNDNPNVEKGVLNISNYDFSTNKEITIKGETLFYWKQWPIDSLGNYDSSKLTNPNYISWPPAIWTSKEFDSKGYGSYRFFIKKDETPFVLNFDRVLGATEIWINGKKHKQFGRLSKTGENEIVDGKQLQVELPQEKELDVILLVSNHQHRLGGGFSLQNKILSKLKYEENQKTNPLIEGLITLLIIIFGCYQLYIYFTFSKEKYFLYFGLYCIIGASRQLFVGETLIYSFIPTISFEIVQKMRYLGYLGGLFIMIQYHNNLFPNYLSKLSIKILSIILLIGIVFIFFSSTYSSTLIMPFYQLYGLFLVLVGFYIVIRASLDDKPYAKWVLIVMMIMSLVFINDILNAMFVIQTKFIVNYGAIFYVIFQMHLNHKIQTEKENKLKELLFNIESLQSNISNKHVEIQKLRNETFQQLKSKEILVDNLKKVAAKDTSISIQNIIANLKSELLEDNQLLNIKSDIELLNIEFTNRLKELHPNLTKTDLEICTYLRMSLGRKEIARLRFTSVEAVKKSRNRLRKKMELNQNIDLEEYLKSI